MNAALLTCKGMFPASALATGEGSTPPWSIHSLAGRLIELQSGGPSASLTIVAGLFLEAQQLGQLAAWVGHSRSVFFPADFAENGIDLESLPVIRPPAFAQSLRTADILLRSEGFAIIALDIPSHETLSLAIQTRLAGLARSSHTALLCLTQGKPASPTLGSLASIRCHSRIQRSGFDQFAWELHASRDKRGQSGWTIKEHVHGPGGLC